MPVYIALLRGINVGGKKLIKMAVLKEILESANFKQVHTYIQSGNIIFEYKKTITETIQEQIADCILQNFKFEVPVLVLEYTEFKNILSKNPFKHYLLSEPLFLHVTFLNTIPESTNIEKLKLLQSAQDAMEIIKNAVYLYCPNSYSNSAFSNNTIENKLKIAATTRNWKTCNEILLIAEKIMA